MATIASHFILPIQPKRLFNLVDGRVGPHIVYETPASSKAASHNARTRHDESVQRFPLKHGTQIAASGKDLGLAIGKCRQHGAQPQLSSAAKTFFKNNTTQALPEQCREISASPIIVPGQPML